MGKPDARISSTLHFSDGDQFSARPKGVEAQSWAWTRAFMPASVIDSMGFLV